MPQLLSPRIWYFSTRQSPFCPFLALLGLIAPPSIGSLVVLLKQINNSLTLLAALYYNEPVQRISKYTLADKDPFQLLRQALQSLVERCKFEDRVPDSVEMHWSTIEYLKASDITYIFSEVAKGSK